MLRGIDISHHNTDEKINEFSIQFYKPEFIIHKLTEGKTYVDPKVKQRIPDMIDITTGLIGFYHFARPDNNTPKDEALNFCSNLPKNTPALLILDWEGVALNYPFTWALEWVKEVFRITGVEPIIYASASVVKKYANQYDKWWTAHYTDTDANGCSHDGVNELITQYKNTPLDTDVFHGSVDDWFRLCGEIADYNSPEILATWEDMGYKYEVTRRAIT